MNMKTKPVEKTHRCPKKDEGLTPCCGKSPFELPLFDRITINPELATCKLTEERAQMKELLRLAVEHPEALRPSPVLSKLIDKKRKEFDLYARWFGVGRAG